MSKIKLKSVSRTQGNNVALKEGDITLPDFDLEFEGNNFQKGSIHKGKITKIEAIDEDTAKELINRSKETLVKEKKAVAEKLKELGVEDSLINLSLIHI